MPDILSLTIRPYTEDDANACRACMAELQDTERRLDSRLRSGDEIADEYLRQMHKRCHDYAGSILVAEHAGAIVGLIMVLTRVPFESLDQPPGHYASVAELVVRDGFRERGFGRALLEAGEHRARTSGAVELRIGVLSQNRPARQLYLREGFAPYSEVLAKSLRPSSGCEAATNALTGNG